jgi:predicted transcriptional regulator
LALSVKRNRIEILAAILEVIKRQRNIRLIRISYGANLPFDRAKKLVEALASSGLVSITRSDEAIVYNITMRGLDFLEAHKKMIGFLEDLKE